MYDIRYLFSNLRHILNFFRATKNKSDMKARMFELPAQGGFQLTEYVPSIEDYFDLSKEIACYSNIDEAEEIIKYYLKNNRKREKIKLNGIKKARENHMYKNRIEDFMIDLNRIKNDNE
ncbi:MAG: hypothetical protein DRG78_02770 [Epsilonproteobacteria bacterium]|nr:MAG: hypothetical protein DRG78_02770 [Campylobacterota bacterium]